MLPIIHISRGEQHCVQERERKMEFVAMKLMNARRERFRSYDDDRDRDHHYERDDDRDRDYHNKDDVVKATWVWVVIFLGIFIVFGTISAFVSWKTNEVVGWGWLPRLIFAIIAFFWPFYNLFFTITHKLDVLLVIRNKCRPLFSSDSA